MITYTKLITFLFISSQEEFKISNFRLLILYKLTEEITLLSIKKRFRLKTIIQEHISEQFIALHQTAIGNFYFYDSYVVTEFKEGVVVDFESCNEFCLLLNRYYNNQKKFAIISKRKFSYSINPTDYRYLKVMLHNLKGIAIVSKQQPDELQKSKLICVEKRLCPRPFSVFTSLTKAKDWVTTLLD